jgi:outer membrane biosynthesis protein TonB
LNGRQFTEVVFVNLQAGASLHTFMPTPVALSSPFPALPARPSWRVLAALTLLVAVLHLLVLGLAPTAIGPEPSPLANKFITRTIVIAPPAAQSAPPSAAAPVEAAPAPPPKPRRPRAPSVPKPKPIPKPEPAPQVAPTPEPSPEASAPRTPDTPDTPDPAAQAAPDSGAPSPEAPAGPALGTGDSGQPGGAAGASSPTAGNIAGTQSLRVPGSVKLSFAATGQRGASPMQGVFGTLEWLQDGSSYDARLTLKLLFSTILSQHSAGKIGPSGIEPERYSESRRGELATHFVRDQGQILFSNNAPPVPLLPGAQDRLSVVMQLGGLLAGDPSRYPGGSQITVQTAGTREAGPWVFNIEGEEKLAVQAGEFVVRKLTRSPRKDFDVKLEVWLAPSLGYLPVRIKQTQPNGDFADMELRESLPAGPAN